MSREEPALPRIKVCGITRSEDALLAASLGAWALGFIFHEKSPRATTPENAGRVISEVFRACGSQGLKTVGVFVNASLETIGRAVELSGINTVQLHGDETPDFCQEVEKLRAPGASAVKVVKALRLRAREELERVSKYSSSCEAILLDTYAPGAWGGTGSVGNWDWAAEASRFAPVILAGGLNPENIRAALETARPFAVDASSGLERVPGEKSPEKIREFFLNASRAKLEMRIHS